ncbi:MAG: hypothetical protein H0X24_09675 [Ktedonobacterales bacterium]|nr:hypothetical protein [Ktedonobacterales bacterium]
MGEDDWSLDFCVPMAHLWDNVIYTCAMQLCFALGADIAVWRHRQVAAHQRRASSRGAGPAISGKDERVALDFYFTVKKKSAGMEVLLPQKELSGTTVLAPE